MYEIEQLNKLDAVLRYVSRNPFFENQQNALLAIARAVKQHDVKFAVVDLTALSTALQVIAEGNNIS